MLGTRVVQQTHAAHAHQRAWQGDFRLVNEAVGFGLVKFSNVPEPAAGMLSLLGMAALATRRRRR